MRQLAAVLATAEGREVAALAEAETAFGYEQSPIVAEVMAGRKARGTKVGFRIGDAAPLERGDAACRLYDLIRAPDHTLLLLGAADSAA